MGLYDDNDENVTRLGGGWAAATQQAKNITYQQQKLIKQKQQQQTKRDIEQRLLDVASQPAFGAAPQKFTPSKFIPQNFRPNLNKNKVPAPGFRQATQSRPPKNKIVEEISNLSAENRDVIDRFTDEYDPLKPNEFSKYVKRRREGKHKVTRYAEQKKAQERELKRDSVGNENSDSSGSDEEPDKRRRAMGMGKAMIAPPQQLYLNTPTQPNMPRKKPTTGSLGKKLGFGGKATTGGLFSKRAPEPEGKTIAEKIMAKYGHTEGSGIGKHGQGMAKPLEVEKTSRRGGKIIGGADYQKNQYPTYEPVTPVIQAPQPIRSLPNLAKPTKIVCLQNMVDIVDIDEDLPEEVTNECLKFGPVIKVKIVEIPNVAPEHAVRIFIEFSRMEEAMKAVIGLHNRFFSGRNLIAAFYDVKKYYDDNMTDTPN